MQRLARYLQDLFTAISPPQLPATAFEMTLHDAQRICTGRMREKDGSAMIWATSRPIEVCWYRSESDLFAIWRCFDNTSLDAHHVSAVLVLGDFLHGNLRELIHRRHLAHRLVIVPHPGHWPGVDSFGDLALAPRSLGWTSIELCRDLQVGSGTPVSSSDKNERLLVVLPANAPARAVM